MMKTSNLLLIQGGGPSPVFNRTCANAVREAVSAKVSEIYGAANGIEGLTRGELRRLDALSEETLQAIERSPGAILGSSRSEPNEDELDACGKHLLERDIHQVMFMGGNGTMAGAASFSRFCRSKRLDIQVIGVPKTIDNDITETDRCPGFASAARYVAQTTLELSEDLRSLPESVTILETMGRDSGWLAASSLLAKQTDEDSPHLVYLPEKPFSVDRFLDDLDKAYSRFGWAMVVVAEGIHYANGERVFEQKIAFNGEKEERPLIGGVAQHLAGIVGDKLGMRCRSEKPGLIGRSCVAQVAIRDQLDAEAVGRAGIVALAHGDTDLMVSLAPITETEEPVTTKLVPFTEIEGEKRPIPNEWLVGSGIPVNIRFRDYARPLVGPLNFPINPLRF